MVTPITLLLTFCLILTGILGWRVLREDDHDRVDLGSLTVVGGITTLTGVWAAIEHAVFTTEARVAMGVIGAILVVVGIGLVVVFWDE